MLIFDDYNKLTPINLSTMETDFKTWAEITENLKPDVYFMSKVYFL